MDKILFSERLKEQIKAKYKTQTAFAIAYDKKYNPGTFCNEAISPHKGTKDTIKKYVSSTAPTIPSLDKIDNMCQMLDCDIDYLLGYIDCPKHIHQAMNQECGLSQKATDQLIYWNSHENCKTKTLNYILESANFDHFLFHAYELMKAKPMYLAFAELYSTWRNETYSQPKPPEGYPRNPKLFEMRERTEMKYGIEKLRVNEYFTFLIAELEKIATTKPDKKGG